MFSFRIRISNASESQIMLAIGLCFMCIGFEFGLWGALLPFLSNKLTLSPWHISVFLFVMGGGLVCAALLLPFVLRVISTRVLIIVCTPAYMLGFTFVLTSETLYMLYCAGAVTGWLSGLLDGAVNLQAIAWEKRTGRKVLSRFHGVYSLGVMLGAGYWVIMNTLGFSVIFALALLFIPCALAMIVLGIGLPTDIQKNTHIQQKNIENKNAQQVPFLLTLLMAVLVIISTSIEGGMVDWGGLYITDTLGYAHVFAGIGVAIFSVAMTVGRLCGDWIATKCTPTIMLGIPALIATLIFCTALVSQSLLCILFAFVCIGLALANAFPLLLRVYSDKLDEHARVAGVAKITGFGYASVMAGPVVYGMVAQWYDYSFTMFSMALAIGMYALLCLWKIR